MKKKTALAKRAVPSGALTRAEQMQVEAAALAALNLAASRTLAQPGTDLQPSPRPDPPSTWRSRADLAQQRAIEQAAMARFLPGAAAITTAASGYAAWGVAELAELATPAGPGLVIFGTALVCTGTLALIRRRIADRMGPWGRRFSTAAAAATAWVTTTAAIGFDPWMLGALALSATALSGRWLAAHEAGLPELTAPPPRPELPVATLATVTVVEEFTARWAKRIARDGQKLPGCPLTEGVVLDGGNVCEFILQLTGGRTLENVHSAHKEIASALGLDPLQLTFGPTPRGPNGFLDSSRIQVQYVLSSPITREVFYTEPSFVLTDSGYGLIDLGPYVDGRSRATYELFRRSGMFSGIAIGSTGLGKSSIVTGIVVSARSSGFVTTLYFDPKGNSSPDLAKHASITVLGLERAEQFTRCVQELIDWLGKQQSLHGKSHFSKMVAHELGRPAYLIVIDECDMLFAIKGMGDRWGDIAKTGRSLGVGLLLATQYGGVKAFGTSELLRSSIRAGNVILMRTTSSTSDALIAPELPRSTTLPREPGYLYLGNDTARNGAARGKWLLASDEEPPPNFPVELHGWNADTALARYPDAPLCAIGQRALAPLLLGTDDRQTRQAAHAAMLRSQLDAYLTGANISPPAALLAEVAGDDDEADIDRLVREFSTLPGPVVELHHHPHAVPAGMTPNQAAVYHQLTQGVHRTSEIAKRSGISESAVSKILGVLSERGLAEKVDNRWRIREKVGA